MIHPKRESTPQASLLAPSIAALLALLGCAEGTLPQLAECAETSTCAPTGSRAVGAAGASGLGGPGETTGGLGGSAAGAWPSGGSAGGGGALLSAGGTGLGGSGSAAGGMGGGSAQADVGDTTTEHSDGSPLIVLSAGKPVTADSEEAGNSAESGSDGDAGTRWCAADPELNHEWTVDLGGIYALSKLEITFEFDGRQYGYVLEGSADGADYEELLDCATNPKQSQVQSEPLNGSARYVRIRFVALPVDTWAGFYELKVLGT